MTDAYKVPDLAPGAFHRAEETVRRSRFIVTMARVSSPEEAKAFIDRIREEHAGATHNCWAYNAGAPGDTAQVGASDDGEPKGTAGRPMLTALLHSDVGEVAAVVTRYFGGILLGTGGLVRAYQGSVKLGLEGLPVTLREDMRRFVVSIEPHQVSDFQHFLAEARGRVQSSDFRFDATFEVLVPSDEADAFVERLSEATAGEALIDPIDEEKVLREIQARGDPMNVTVSVRLQVFAREGSRENIAV